MPSHQPIGPFCCGDIVDIDDGDRIIARGVVDGEREPIDDEYAYDVKGDDGRRYDDVSEIHLTWRGSAA